MSDYPAPPVQVNRVEPVPRRIRAFLAGQAVVDHPRPLRMGEPELPALLHPARRCATGRAGRRGNDQGDLAWRRQALQPACRRRHPPARRQRPLDRQGRGPRQHGPLRLVRLRFLVRGGRAGLRASTQPLHPGGRPAVEPAPARGVQGRRPGGVLVARLCFETGLPTRYYLDRTDVDFTHWSSDTETSCPYKGTTSGYWSARVEDRIHPDIAWTYDFPTRELLPIAGLIAFYNEKIDLCLDGVELERPRTHLS